MLQAGSLKSLALKVLREAGDGGASEKSCPTGVISRESSEMGQELGQSVGQAPAVPARVRGQDAVVESCKAETCFHCKGDKVCRCAMCAVADPNMVWQRGMCRACLGTGSLAWPETVQGI